MSETHLRENNDASTPHSALNEEADHSSLASTEAESISAEIPGTHSDDKSELHSNIPERVLKAFMSECMQLQGGESSVNDVLGESNEPTQHLGQINQEPTDINFLSSSKSSSCAVISNAQETCCSSHLGL